MSIIFIQCQVALPTGPIHIVAVVIYLPTTTAKNLLKKKTQERNASEKKVNRINDSCYVTYFIECECGISWVEPPCQIMLILFLGVSSGILCVLRLSVARSVSGNIFNIVLHHLA